MPMTPDSIILGAELATYRTVLGLSRSALAAALEVSITSVYNYENGITKAPQRYVRQLKAMLPDGAQQPVVLPMDGVATNALLDFYNRAQAAIAELYRQAKGQLELHQRNAALYNAPRMHPSTFPAHVLAKDPDSVAQRRIALLEEENTVKAREREILAEKTEAASRVEQEEAAIEARRLGQPYDPSHMPSLYAHDNPWGAENWANFIKGNLP